uniref:Uncharacterized protein n=1 Tax=viral metagenome TaxID=1070528 RepID=A0A6M3LU85_9ZZZZ
MHRRFWLERVFDPSGVSGVGNVAEGIQFSNGKCVIGWLTVTPSVAVYDSMEALIEVHGHAGGTLVRWID